MSTVCSLVFPAFRAEAEWESFYLSQLLSNVTNHHPQCFCNDLDALQNMDPFIVR